MTICVAGTGLLLCLSAALAGSVAARAQNAEEMATFGRVCTMDYFALCAGLSPGGPEVRACFRANRAQLSADCAAAISAYEQRQRMVHRN